MTPRKPGDPIPLELQTATRARDGKPFVRLSLGAETILMDPTEARSLGGMLIDYAGLSESEAAMVRILKATDAGTGDAEAHEFISRVTAERAKLRTETTVN